MRDFLSNDPCRHRVDVKTFDIATDSVRLDERSAAAHERIQHETARERVAFEEALRDGLIAELGQNQSPEQAAGPARKPFMHRDDRPIVLLDLLFLQGKRGDDWNVKLRFDRHRRV
ncbi:MAG: hypothetical protein ACREFQ_19110, partial [Stellaceae bacterium]